MKVIPENTHDYTENLLSYKPDYFLHGDDWRFDSRKLTRDKVIELLNTWGGKLVEPPSTPGFNSNELLKKYEKRFRKISLPIYLATNGIVRLYSSQKPITKLARKSLLRIANTFWPVKNAIIDELLLKNS